MTLRQKLPLLVSLLSVGTLLLAGVLAYGEVRGSARAAASSRLFSAAHELADLSAVSVESRQALEDSVAGSRPVRRALAGSPVDTAALISTLRRLDGAGSEELPVELRDATGRIAFRVGSLPRGVDDPDPRPPLEATRTTGPFRPVGDRVLYWNTFPVRDDGEVRGWIAQRRQLGNPQTGEQLEGLIGGGIEILVGRPPDSVWVDLGGRIEGGPSPDLALERGFVYTRPDGAELFALATRLSGTPWTIVVGIPMSAVTARPRAFLRTMLLAGAVLTLGTILLAWVMSRRLTDPLHELALAADDMAAGDYGRRVHVEGGDELARVGRAFNAMGEEVERADEALRQRLEEAEALALRLEEASQEASRAHEEAQAASRAKSEFLATMSHELRTPINAIVGYADLLREGIPDVPTEGQRDYLERLERSSRLLLSLVDDILDLERIESGRLRLAEGVGSVREALLVALAVLDHEAQRKEISLSHDVDEEVYYRGDPQRVEQILLNLLSNAIKFTEPGGTVTVRAEVLNGDGGGEQAGERVRIDVEDTGIGIDEKDLATVFEPFVQARSGLTRRHGGAGLGLPISRRLARMMGGEVEVRSEPGEGSRFTLWLTAPPEPPAG